MTTERCDKDGRTFVAPKTTLNLLTAYSADQYIVDVGGFCPLCRKHLCPRHVYLKEIHDELPGKVSSSTGTVLHHFVLACREHDQALVLRSDLPSDPVGRMDRVADLAELIAAAADSPPKRRWWQQRKRS